MSRGDITDKWHRVCKQCGEKVHVSKIRVDGTYNCEGCGYEYFTRNKHKTLEK